MFELKSTLETSEVIILMTIDLNFTPGDEVEYNSVTHKRFTLETSENKTTLETSENKTTLETSETTTLDYTVNEDFLDG